MKIYYFSGTGNSFWTAKTIGEYFGADVRSIVDFKAESYVYVNSVQKKTKKAFKK